MPKITAPYLAKYNMTINLQMVEELNALHYVQGPREFAEMVCQLVADELATQNIYTAYNIIKAEFDIKRAPEAGA